MIFILVFFCLWSRWVEGTCGKRSVAQIEACAAKAERKEWKEWEKEAEIPKNEKNQWNLRIFTIQSKTKQPGSLKWTWMTIDSGNFLFFNRDSGIENGEKLCDVQWMSSFQVPKIAPSRPLSRLSMRSIRSCGKMKWKPIQYVYAMCHHPCRVIERSNWSHSSATPIVSIWEIFGSFDLKYLQCGLCSLQRSKSRDCSYSPTGQTGQSKLRFIFAV